MEDDRNIMGSKVILRAAKVQDQGMFLGDRKSTRLNSSHR